MKVRNYLLPVFMFALFWSCSGNLGTAGGEEANYFPVKDFIEVQAQKLSGRTIYKEVNVNGEKESSTQVLNEEDWLKELDFFIQADINRPALASAYETQRSDRFLIHELKEGEKSKIKKVVVEYVRGDMKQISFQSKTENPFYTSQTRGIVILHGQTGLIDNFSVETIQEVIFSKPNKIVISAHVKEL